MMLNRNSFKTDKEFTAYVRSQLEIEASKRGISKAVAFAIAEQESSWNPNAIGKPKNGSVDAGLMQVNSINWPRFGFKKAEDLTGNNWSKGMLAGLDIYAEELKAFNGNSPLALAAYNAGGGKVRQWQRGIADLPEITRNYVPQILARTQKYGQDLSNADMQSVTALFKPTKSLEKIAKAAGIKPIVPTQRMDEAALAAAGDVPQVQMSDLKIAQADAASQIDSEAFAFNDEFLFDDPANFSLPEPQYVPVARAPKQDEIKALREKINVAFNSTDEYDPNGAVESYIEGMMNA